VLLGANHQLVNELRWHSADVDGRASLLRHCFDVRACRASPIRSWSGST
jgi:hypothetical protein